MSSINKRKKTIALHPGKCKQDVVFHITKEKKNKTKLFQQITEYSLFTYDVMVNVSLANQAH